MRIAKGFLILSSILIGLIFVPQVSAETATSSSKPNPKREIINTKITRDKVEEKKVERVEKLTSIKRERIMSFSNKMIVRLEATIERLEKLITRIEERIVKIETTSNDINVSEIKVSLNQAKQKLTLIKSDVITLKESLNDVTTSEDPKAMFEEAREKLNGIKEDIKDVHSILVKLIGDIKGLRVGEDKNEK